MKRTVLLVLLIAALLAVPVFADGPDLTYSGILDDFTGEPVVQATETPELPTERIQLMTGVYFDPEMNDFVFTLPGGSEIRSSVADGMVVTGSVTLDAPANTSVLVYLDGTELSPSRYANLTETGSYVVRAQDNGVTREILSFTIVNSVTGALNEYRVPTGFAITEILREQQPQPLNSRTADLTREGKYAITYCGATFDKRYTLEVTIDHTPPVLALEAVGEDGIAKGTVDISDLEPGASILVVHDGVTQVFKQEKLTEAGEYTLRVEDEAGNVTTYQFTIGVYLNLSAWVFVIVIAAVIAATGLYMWISKKRLRIR